MNSFVPLNPFLLYYRVAAQDQPHKTERCPSWPKEHDWKSCIRQKRIWGSNPHLSATLIQQVWLCPSLFCFSPQKGFEPMRWNRVKQTCQWHVCSDSPDRACEGGVRLRKSEDANPHLSARMRILCRFTEMKPSSCHFAASRSREVVILQMPSAYDMMESWR